MDKKNFSQWILIIPSFVMLAYFPWAGAQDNELISKTFLIDNMTCATCPISVRTAISRVDGVKRVSIDFGTKTADVTYDLLRTDDEKIAIASSSVGFPARVAKEAINE